MADPIDAVFGVNSYIINALTTASLDAGRFYPGVYAPPTENGTKFVLYQVRANNLYDLKALNVVYATYTMYNSDFEQLHRISAVVGNALDVENIQNTSLSKSGVHYKETTVNFTGSGEASFVDGTNYYLLSFMVKIQFTLG